MTIASLLLALCTAAPYASSDAASPPVLLDFHAEWCGPCQKMRPIVKQLKQNKFPVKSIDIDHDPGDLATRYRVQAVPTFVVVDGSGRELDRTKGTSSAGELARFYKAAAAKAESTPESNDRIAARRQSRSRRDDDESDEEKEPRASRTIVANRRESDSEERADLVFTNPKPWESSVRIRVVGPHSTGFGSGTIIHSTPDESIILTCAHIFHLEGVRNQAPPSRFPRKIMIDLFDGKMKQQRNKVAKVDFVEAVEGRAVDYDFKRDVGLIRIRPGKQLAFSRVVPAHWEPLRRMSMLTVGCSEGEDATAWSTAIIEPRRTSFLSGRPEYEAIECFKAPKQGRSGGGLFTDNGYLAGVCDFAEPQGDHGLYATPRSIYKLLDRNNLMALYAPPTRGTGTLVADRRSGSRAVPATAKPFARSQSPDREEPAGGRAVADDPSVVMIPPPTLLGIVVPEFPREDRAPRAASTTRRTNWLPTHKPAALGGDKAADNDNDDRFDPPFDEPDPLKNESDREDEMSPRSNAGSAIGSPAKPRWRAVKSAPAGSSGTESAN
jgi:thiol-disulfide isomerase/thioredoxin